jgi:hypothetical protein
MTEKVLERAARLPQGNATWHATARRAPAWITPKNKPPYRPYVILVLDAQSDRIRQTKMEDDRPTPEVVLAALADAMQKPVLASGKPVRPARIVLDDAELARALTPRLAEIGVRCDHQATLPLVSSVLRDMEAHMNRAEPRPGLLSVPGATLPLVEELFAAAAEFYRLAPWRWMDNLAALEVHYPADGPARYAAIMGFGGEVFGLVVYPSLDDLRIQISDLKPEQIFKKMTAISINFDEPMALSFDDLDALEKYNWPVAAAEAYPQVIKATPPGKVGVPTAAEIALLAAALRVIPDFVTRHLRADRGAPRPAAATYPLTNVHGGQQIALRYPVDLPELKAQQALVSGEADEEELQNFIADWGCDDASRDFARQLGAFLLQFMDYLAKTDISDQALERHEENCWLIGKLTCEYGRRQTFSPAIFLEGPAHLNEFKQKVSSSPRALASYKATWRKLEEYVRAMG